MGLAFGGDFAMIRARELLPVSRLRSRPGAPYTRPPAALWRGELKKLPFYKMYPADAEVDENFRLMSFESRGVYWTLLNHSWINDGLPESIEDIRELLRMAEKDFSRVWVRVSKCFEVVDGRHRNRRQEVERFEVRSKSEKATDAVRTRYERSTNVGRHAGARALTSDSVSESDSQKKESGSEFEESFERLYAAHPKKDGKVLAQQALARAVENSDDVRAQCARIEAAHALWLPEFRRAGKFAPQLHRWLSDQKYLDDPPANAEEEYSVIASLRKAVGG